jgi:hypothetical protein
MAGDGDDDGDDRGKGIVLVVAVAVVIAVVSAIVWRRPPDDDDMSAVAERTQEPDRPFAERADDVVVTDDAVDGVPLRPGTFRAGGELADGLRVPEGTVLLGDVLPTDRAQPSRAEPGSGWRAYLLVAGEMGDVLLDVARQADAAGLVPVADIAAAAGDLPPAEAWGCRRDDPGWHGRQACRFAWRGAGGRELRAELDRGRRASTGEEDAPVSLLALTVVDRTAGPVPATAPAVPTMPEFTGTDPGLPGGWAEPPAAGERLGEGVVPAEGAVAPLRLPEAADALVAPWPTGDTGLAYGGIAELTGDVDAALADLAAQLRERTGREVPVEHATVPGAAIDRLVAGVPGEGSYVVTATTVADRTWLTVETSYDP